MIVTSKIYGGENLKVSVSSITQQQQVQRNIFAYSDREGFSLFFGYVYVKFKPRPKKLLAVQDKNLGSQVPG